MGTLCSSGVALFKAGKNVSGDLTGTEIDHAILQAESIIYAAMRNNLSGVYATLNPAVKYILEDTCSDLAAINLITFDMSGYTTRIEAEDMINVLRDRALFNISILRDKKVQKFIEEA